MMSYMRITRLTIEALGTELAFIADRAGVEDVTRKVVAGREVTRGEALLPVRIPDFLRAKVREAVRGNQLTTLVFNKQLGCYSLSPSGSR